MNNLTIQDKVLVTKLIKTLRKYNYSVKLSTDIGLFGETEMLYTPLQVLKKMNKLNYHNYNFNIYSNFEYAGYIEIVVFSHYRDIGCAIVRHSFKFNELLYEALDTKIRIEL